MNKKRDLFILSTMACALFIVEQPLFAANNSSVEKKDSAQKKGDTAGNKQKVEYQALRTGFNTIKFVPVSNTPNNMQTAKRKQSKYANFLDLDGNGKLDPEEK